MDRHIQGEEILLKDGLKQSDIWGGGVDLDTEVIDFNSMINIRPNEITIEAMKSRIQR